MVCIDKREMSLCVRDWVNTAISQEILQSGVLLLLPNFHEWLHRRARQPEQSTSCFGKFPACDGGVISELICAELGLGHGLVFVESGELLKVVPGVNAPRELLACMSSPCTCVHASLLHCNQPIANKDIGIQPHHRPACSS